MWKAVLAGTAITSMLILAPTAEAASYTVQKGDTLIKIAKAHNTTIHKLKQLNELGNDQIYINQKLIVVSNNVAITNPIVQEQKASTNNAKIYIVQKGDNLTKIANEARVTVLKLKEWNKLKSDAIYVGQKLILQQGENGQAFDSSKPVEKEITSTNKTEVVITIEETTDEAIAKQLASEKEITSGVSAETKAIYTKVLQVADKSIGVPYLYGGYTMSGFDCSGFVSYAYNEAGVKNTRKSSLMYFAQDTTKVKNPIPGDIIFFKNTFIPSISHMGIYTGNDEFIHAGSAGVGIGNLKAKYWSERFVAFKRLTVIK